MFGPKLVLTKALMDKLKQAAELSGCSSVDEYAQQILEAEADKVLAQAGVDQVSEEEVEDIANKLKGLGYLD